MISRGVSAGYCAEKVCLTVHWVKVAAHVATDRLGVLAVLLVRLLPGRPMAKWVAGVILAVAPN